jgi:hypothetical protein
MNFRVSVSVYGLVFSNTSIDRLYLFFDGLQLRMRLMVFATELVLLRRQVILSIMMMQALRVMRMFSGVLF